MKRGVIIAGSVAIVVGVALIYWWHATTSAQGELSDLLLYAPAESKAIVYIDVAALRNSAFASDLTAVGPAEHPDREYLEFVKNTGFDYSRDLDRVMLVIRNASSPQVDFAIAEGRFDHSKIAAYAGRGGKVERGRSAEYYEFATGAPAQLVSLAFMDANRVAIAQGPGARERLESLLQRGPKSALDPQMHERLLRVAGSPIFVTGQLDQIPDPLAASGIRSEQLSNLVKSIRWITAGVRPEGELLKIAADGECSSAENARQLAGTMDALQMLAQSAMSDAQTRTKLSPQGVALLDAALRDLRVSHEGARVRLTLEMTHAQVREVLRSRPALSAPGR